MEDRREVETDQAVLPKLDQKFRLGKMVKVADYMPFPTYKYTLTGGFIYLD